METQLATWIILGSSCGSVGRVVASNTRSPRFESSHQQNFCIKNLYYVNCFEIKDKNKEKETARIAHLKNL